MNRLLAVHAPATELGELIVISVELWTDCVFVHFARLENEETDRLNEEFEAAIAAWKREGRDLENFPEQPGVDTGHDLTLADDAETRYRRISGRAGGSGSEWRGMVRFEPAVPDDASRLTIATADGGVEVEL